MRSKTGRKPLWLALRHIYLFEFHVTVPIL